MPVLTKNDPEIKKYQDYIKGADFTSITQTLEWGHVKSNWDGFYVYLGDIDNPTAAMSILTINGLAYCSKGYVGDDFNVDTLDALVAEADPVLKENNCFLLRIDPEVPFNEKLDSKLADHGYTLRNRNLPLSEAHSTIQPRFNFVMDIKDADPEDILMSFHSKTRYNIRLAKRKGVTIESGDTQEFMDQFYETYKVMSDRHDITYRPKAYFDRMVEAFSGKDMMNIYLASVDGEVIAGSICFEYGDKAWYMYGGSLNSHRNFMAPHLLQWAMIEHAIADHKERYDFGGIFGFDVSDGLYKFKHGFFKDSKYLEYIGEIDHVLNKKRYDGFVNK
ncbi:lipid II:glycine glycyltransferase FemX [Companilactobacillus keshanensis]|uniref:Lipid II:glycine glycyltransferase FemX n=1 Tax=Companilactobacillus keshanensis TaxID=2486003 RepID=A0ABW4BVY9_9LACO|nr:peptidoglycan bridge formation glycyltransferase FemA/FemB family protein [Companilactobacillus keshanensis]